VLALSTREGGVDPRFPETVVGQWLTVPMLRVEEGVVMSPNVVAVKREDLEDRRARLLAEVGLSMEELRARGASFSLAGSEWEVLTELEEIEFLLND
jgi:hypothetical protein